MEKIVWEELSTSEIKLKQLSLKELYENKKNKIAALLDDLDYLDSEYIKGENELNKRQINSNKLHNL